MRQISFPLQKHLRNKPKKATHTNPTPHKIKGSNKIRLVSIYFPLVKHLTAMFLFLLSCSPCKEKENSDHIDNLLLKHSFIDNMQTKTGFPIFKNANIVYILRDAAGCLSFRVFAVSLSLFALLYLITSLQMYSHISTFLHF